MKPCQFIFTICLSLLIIYGCNPPSHQDPSFEGKEYAFVHASIIKMDQEAILSNQTVWVRGQNIYKIGDSDRLSLPEGIDIIEAEGKYLLPGLAEMHAHIPVPKGEKDTLAAETLFLYLANGVTTIRGMLGDPFHLSLRQQVKDGEVLGPRIYTSGPSLNGNSVPTDTTAIRKVKAQQLAGYDFMKIHPGIKRAVFDSLVSTAIKVGIKYAGHVPLDVGIRRAIESNYASVDHLDGYLEGMVPENAGLDPYSNGFFGFNFVDVADLSLLPALARATKAANVAVVPTQCLLERWTSPEKPSSMISQPEMKYMHPRTLLQWEKQGYGFQGQEGYSESQYHKFISLRREIIRALKEAEVLLLLGSDSPQVFNVPGFSIHRELTSMVKAGLSPFEALQTGTYNPAVFFNATSSFGSIEEGRSADMILTNANPLEEVKHALTHEGVMVRGRWLPRNYIDMRLQKIAEKYAQIRVKGESL